MKYSTMRENEVEKVYKRLNIENPHDLTISNLSSLFRIKVEYIEGESECYYNDKCAYMFLDIRQSAEEIRSDFFHEMSHFTQHCGDQRIMPLEFERLQERQAHWVALYLSMPRYIFEPILNEVRSLEELRHIFRLPDSMIRERIRIIRNQNAMQAQFQRIKEREESKINRTLQKGKIHTTTLSIIRQLSKQVGEEKINDDIKSLLR